MSDCVAKDNFSSDLNMTESWKGQGRGKRLSCRNKLSILTPCHSPPMTPIPCSQKAKALTLAHKTSTLYPPQPLPLTSCSFCSTHGPLHYPTNAVANCVVRSWHWLLLLGEILFFHLPSRPVPLTSLKFCSNVIFSVMPTLTFLLKIVACPHCR